MPRPTLKIEKLLVCPAGQMDLPESSSDEHIACEVTFLLSDEYPDHLTRVTITTQLKNLPEIQMVDFGQYVIGRMRGLLSQYYDDRIQPWSPAQFGAMSVHPTPFKPPDEQQSDD